MDVPEICEKKSTFGFVFDIFPQKIKFASYKRRDGGSIQ